MGAVLNGDPDKVQYSTCNGTRPDFCQGNVVWLGEIFKVDPNIDCRPKPVSGDKQPTCFPVDGPQWIMARK